MSIEYERYRRRNRETEIKEPSEIEDKNKEYIDFLKKYYEIISK